MYYRCFNIVNLDEIIFIEYLSSVNCASMVGINNNGSNAIDIRNTVGWRDVKLNSFEGMFVRCVSDDTLTDNFVII